MNDFRDLKAIAEACQQHQPLRFMRSHGALYIRNDNGIVFDVHQNRSFPEFMAQNKDYADLVLAANPETILALIAENASMTEFKEHMAQLRETHGFDSWSAALVAVDRLKAENGRLKAGVDSDLAEMDRIQGEYDKQFRKARALRIARDQLKAENEALRKDAERYQWMSTEGNWVARFHGKWRAHAGEYGDKQPTDWYPSRDEAIDAAMGKGE